MEYIIKYHGALQQISPAAELLNEHYAIVEDHRDDIQALLGHPQVEYIEPAEKLYIAHSASDGMAAPTAQADQASLRGAGVVVGIIDSGLDLTHPEFQSLDGRTRVLALWDLTQDGAPPAGFQKGTVFLAEDIDAGRCSSRDVVGHGTAVAGIAAGSSGAAPEAAIIAVKVEGSGTRTPDVMRGIQYIIDLAQQLGMPCAINLSYGTNNGSHQGQSLFEAYIDEMSQRWKTVIICACGNEGFGGHHFHDRIAQGGVVVAEFAVACQRPSIYMTLWKNFADDMRFQLISPHGAIAEIPQQGHYLVGNVHVTVLEHGPTHYSAAQEFFFLLEADAAQLHGLWTLRCLGGYVVDGVFDIWLPTTEEVTDRTAFLRPCTEMTATLPSTARLPVSVGGYNAESGAASAFSGRGGSGYGGQQIPTLVAPAEHISSARAGGGYDVYSGTSMAAPAVTGAAALMLEWGVVRRNDPFLYGQRVKAYLCKNAARSAHITYPNAIWGYGALDLAATLEDLEPMHRGVWRI